MINTVILKPTHRCNFNCVYCYDRFERSKDSTLMPVEDCIKVIKKVYEENPHMSIVWHGGEPTVVGKEYFKKVCSSVPKTIDGKIQTNGSMIDEEWAEILKEFDVDVGISWDGIQHDGTRGKLDLSKVLSILRATGQKDPGLLMTLTPYNANTILESFVTAREVYDLYLDFGVLFGEEISKEEYDIMINALLELFSFICQQPDYPVVRPFNFIMDFFCGKILRLCEFMNCSKKGMGITPECNVVPCGKPGDEDFTFGNLLEEGITVNDIMESEKHQKFGNACIKLGDNCKDCEYVIGCHNGCIWRNVDKDFNTSKDPLYCYYQKSLFEGVKRVINDMCQENLLVNKEIIEYLTTNVKGTFSEGRNYKSPLTETKES